MMNRRSFCRLLFLLGATSPAMLAGCGGTTPEKWKEKQENCEHEWVTAPSGETRCKKCGVYQPK
jgi:hypothetical protein